MKFTRLVLTALTLIAVSVPAPAQTVTTKSYSYFSIGGKTLADIDREFLKRGPFSKRTGMRHPGATQIRMKAAIEFAEQGSSCRVTAARVTLDTKIILPKWKNRKRTDPKTALIWDTLALDIKRHEERHAEIARQHARALEKKLKALPRQNNCKKLNDMAEAASAKAGTAHEADQARFDRAESASFERRIIRLLGYNAERRAKGTF